MPLGSPYRVFMTAHFAAWNRIWSDCTKIPRYALADQMAVVCGFKNFRDMVEGHSNETLETLKLWSGPHGYAMFKAMQAKRSGT